MNHVYRVVFNHALKCVQVVSEFARSRSTVSSSTARRAPQLAALSTAIALSCAAPAALAAQPGWNEWLGGNGTNWATPGNWAQGEPTSNSAAAYIDSGRTAEVLTTGEQSNHLHVGDTGRGNLNILAGGQLTTSTIFIGTGVENAPTQTADGRVRIAGIGSSWTALTTIGVGHLGSGLVDVEAGGLLAVGIDSYIGSGVGSVGVVNVTGAGSSYTTGSNLMVGHFGNGTVTVKDGATVSARTSFVGQNAGATGLMEVIGTGSTWTTTQAVYIGQLSTGTARILQGGTATAGSGLYLGSAANGNGTLVVSGNNSSFSAGSAQMLIGGQGTGSVTVAGGGRLSGGETWMGNTASGNGSLLVTGADSTFQTSNLKVGTNGIGHFQVDDGAVATVTGSVDLAMAGTSRGTVIVGNDATLAVGSALASSITAGTGQSLFELAGGTLRANSTLTLNTAVAMSADSTLDARNNVLAQRAFSGNGRLTKTGSASLTLTDVDNSAWTGGVQVNEGSLWVGGSKALGGGWLGMADGTTLGLSDGVNFNNSVQMLGEVAVVVADGESATLAGNVSGGSSTTLVKRDAGTLTLGGGTVGETRVEGGTLRVTGNALNGGNIEIGSGASFETDTTRVLSYAGQISGSGFLRQGRHSLTLTGDSSAFTGTTVINGGELNVTGSLGGDVQVTRGGWLTGNGSLGNVFVSGFSTLSPGSATGTAISRLDIAGVLNFDDTSTFQVDLAANGASDFVSVGGTTLLGQANTVAVATDGDWAPSTRYRILTAAGGVNGTFSGVTSNLAFLDPTLEYDANNVYLTMARNDVSMPDIELAFPDVVVNTNQKQVAGAVEALGEGNAVYDAVVRLEVPQVVPAFDSLSGEVHAAHRGTLLQNRFLHDGIDRHLDGRAISGEVSPGLRVWLAGSGGQQRTDATANSTATRVSQDGLMAGAGWQVGEALELGVAAGQQRLETRLRSGNGQAETDSTEYGVYAAYQWQGVRLRGGVTRADYRTDSTRTAKVGSTLSEDLTAREDATGTTAFVRAGWTFGGARLQLTPEIELAQVNLDSDGSQERGGNSALVIGSADSDYRTGVAALKADWDISGGQRDRAVLTARVGWQYADGDRLPVADTRFVAGTRDFTIAGTPLARSTALAQLGVAISPSANSRVSLQVQGRRGGDQRELGAQLDWSVGF